MPNTVTFSVRMPKAYKERLETLVKAMGRSANYVAGKAISSYLDENAWQVEETGKAVEKADAGGPFVRHEDATAYLDALAAGENPVTPSTFRTR